MKKTYITTMPDTAGAFLKASDAIAQEGGNIVRVNYNKALDLHTLFLDVEADESRLRKITGRLEKIGYLAEKTPERQVMLVELKLSDTPGAVKPVLEKLNGHRVNISYLNSQANGSGYQYFKMGLQIENPADVRNLLDEIAAVCDVRILEYSVTEKFLDNTVFYLRFANEMRELLGLDQQESNQFIIESNKIMQLLDAKNESPFKTFEYVRDFARFIVEHRGERFNPVVAKRKFSDRVNAYIIEPPCGSNTYILDDGEELLFVDGGFQCFTREMRRCIETIIPGMQDRKKRLLLTHADIDHVGLVPLFDEVLVSENCYRNLVCDYEGVDNFREQNHLHAPYCRLSKIISGYKPSHPGTLHIIGSKRDDDALSPIGEMTFGDLRFNIYEGNGGHVKGETILFDPDKRILFTGDNLVNIQGFSKEQKAFNKLAPYLMTSVNMNSEKASVCRTLLLHRAAGCLVCPGHGMWEEYQPSSLRA